MPRVSKQKEQRRSNLGKHAQKKTPEVLVNSLKIMQRIKSWQTCVQISDFDWETTDTETHDQGIGVTDTTPNDTERESILSTLSEMEDLPTDPLSMTIFLKKAMENMSEFYLYNLN